MQSFPTQPGQRVETPLGGNPGIPCRNCGTYYHYREWQEQYANNPPDNPLCTNCKHESDSSIHAQTD